MVSGVKTQTYWQGDKEDHRKLNCVNLELNCQIKASLICSSCHLCWGNRELLPKHYRDTWFTLQGACFPSNPITNIQAGPQTG